MSYHRNHVLPSDSSDSFDSSDPSDSLSDPVKTACWESLTIQDRYIFGKVMSEPENALPLLQLLFPELEIDHIDRKKKKKTQEASSHSKFVRFDVYIRDSARRAFTLEMQVVNKDSLPLRSRYYASMMDTDLMEPGMLYKDMPEAYIVFICPFDLFHLGLHRYTFYNQCEEVPGMRLADRTKRIFLCTDSKENDISSGLRSFLNYVSGGDPEDQYTKHLDDAVRLAKSDSDYRRRYMRWDHELANERYLAREEGLAEGKAEGIAEGRAEGLAEGKAEGLAEGLAEGKAEGLAQGLAEGKAVGLAEGKAEGKAEGLKEGGDRINALNRYLLRDGRIDDLSASVTDPALQERLLKEYSLV